MAAQRTKQGQADILEAGHIYFFYRPRVEEEDPDSPRDIQQFSAVLSPYDKKVYRLLQMGRRRMPDPQKAGRERFWGFVDQVTDRPDPIDESLKEQTYGTKTRGERRRPAARPVGQGVYHLLRHDDHTHLAYELEVPDETREVQRQLNIDSDASYIIAVKNPEAGAPRSAGLKEERQAKYPKKLQGLFRGRRFAECDPPDFLDRSGTEFLLTAASADVPEELGIDIDTHREDSAEKEIFQDLKLDRSEHPVEPLFAGTWE